MKQLSKSPVVIALAVTNVATLLACIGLLISLLRRPRFEHTKSTYVMFDTKTAQTCLAKKPNVLLDSDISEEVRSLVQIAKSQSNSDPVAYSETMHSVDLLEKESGNPQSLPYCMELK